MKPMELTDELRATLKRMWEIHAKACKDLQSLTDNEARFYSNNLSTIQEYYNRNAAYWNECVDEWGRIN